MRAPGRAPTLPASWGQYFAKDKDAARWSIAKGVRLAADDRATSEKRPAAYGKELFSLHEPLGDAKVSAALLAITPLTIQGGTGSPLRALAPAPRAGVVEAGRTE